ncbi:unnamed protein product, partial [Ectocarpus sp. 4 AP-2014]
RPQHSSVERVTGSHATEGVRGWHVSSAGMVTRRPASPHWDGRQHRWRAHEEGWDVLDFRRVQHGDPVRGEGLPLLDPGVLL